MHAGMLAVGEIKPGQCYLCCVLKPFYQSEKIALKPTNDLVEPQNDLHSSLLAMKYFSGLETLGLYTLFSLTGWDLSFALAGGLCTAHTMVLSKEVDNVADDKNSKEWEHYATVEAVIFAGFIPLSAVAEIHPILKLTSIMASVAGCGWFTNLHKRCLEYRLKPAVNTVEEL